MLRLDWAFESSPVRPKCQSIQSQGSNGAKNSRNEQLKRFSGRLNLPVSDSSTKTEAAQGSACGNGNKERTRPLASNSPMVISPGCAPAAYRKR